jgi:voltage-gated potassium channel
MSHRALDPIPRHSASRLITPLVMIAGVVVLGTVGYMLVEGWPFQDSLWMTVITMTTIGYGEVNPLTSAGRWFTIGLIFLSISAAGYAITQLTTFVVEGELNRMFQARRMDQRITSMKDHFIVCGGGHVGQHIASEFVRTRTPFVVIEPNVDMAQQLEQMGEILYIKGDPTQNNTLLQAQIQAARGLIATLPKTRENIFIVLSARALNRTLRIVSRVIHDENEEKLRLAGANEIISTDAIGGCGLPRSCCAPALSRSWMTYSHRTAMSHSKRLHHARVAPRREIHRRGAPGITGRSRYSGSSPGRAHHVSPDPSTSLAAGDVLFVLGNPSEVAALRRK